MKFFPRWLAGNGPDLALWAGFVAKYTALPAVRQLPLLPRVTRLERGA
jgi:hypothetical protein